MSGSKLKLSKKEYDKKVAANLALILEADPDYDKRGFLIPAKMLAHYVTDPKLHGPLIQQVYATTKKMRKEQNASPPLNPQT